MDSSFEIPPELTSFMKLDAGVEGRFDLASSLVDPEKKGELISLAALADEEVSTFLTKHFARPSRANAFSAMIDDALTFSRKIEILKKVVKELDSNPDNYLSHLQFLDSLRRLRNTAAHTYGLSPAEIAKLASTSGIAEMVADFPRGVFTRIKALRDYLATLPSEA